jgi:adenylate cyclase
MKKLILLFFISQVCTNALAQLYGQDLIDSLLGELRNHDAKKIELGKTVFDIGDTVKVGILCKLAREFSNTSDFDKARQFADDALEIARKITMPDGNEGYKFGMANAYNVQGIISQFQGNFSDALEYHFSALNIRKEYGEPKGIADSYNNIGIIYSIQGKYPDALKYHFDALKIREQMGDKNGIAMAHNNIGIIYAMQGNYSEALQSYKATLKIRETLGDKSALGDSYNNIGIIHFNLGNYPEALQYYYDNLKIREEMGNKKGIAEAHCNIALVYDRQENLNEAIDNYSTSLKIFSEIGDKDGIAKVYKNIGSINIKLGKFAEAKPYLLKGLELAKETGAKDVIKEAYRGLAELDSATGNWKDAFRNHQLFIQYRDSLVNEENTRKTVQNQMQYEFDKKEALNKIEQDKRDALAQKELQKQKLVRNGFVGGFAVVLLFAGIFFKQRNRTIYEKRKSEELLLNILPAEVASELKKTGSAKAKAYTMVTVMFTDFKDFTSVSEKVSAELLVDEIHHCFSAFDKIIQKHNIEKIKTIGDAYLCASGIPASNFTHAEDMIKAAIEVRNFMLERKKEKQTKGEIPFDLRIGIHTGPVVAGIVGVKKYAYDIWGDTVNLAARIEQNCEPGKINISGSTYELVKDKFICQHRGKISAKNKGDIDMYFVEG